MSIIDLICNDIKKDLTAQIIDIDFDKCSHDELVRLRQWARDKEKSAGILTMEGEFVGYTYTNLAVLEKKKVINYNINRK